jgi:hypothetical protein
MVAGRFFTGAKVGVMGRFAKGAVSREGRKGCAKGAKDLNSNLIIVSLYCLKHGNFVYLHIVV